MKIGLFGGVFNPPHIGHLIIAQQILDFTDVEEVWFLPNFGQSFPKETIPVEHRVVMTRMLQMPRTKTSTIEIDNRLDGKTIHLIPYLPKEHAFSFIIGADQLPVFHQWEDWEMLLQHMPFLVFPRYGYPTEPLYENMKLVCHQQLMATDISSTKIRARIKQGLPIDRFVPARVDQYIKDHGLYV
ncbi:nicotinate (nicotinamide) nucleotide adenylyltransferase [Patescibacteria group bacterium]|nr:nicotinate (nicotinamide) nucleotide adenylyltransferase [Patescibacteria group bacterium]MBU1472182.1 nicotinate (nicotinamide) nucleotide adenylyltransferase [Patescibacteria group bacterium]MBU2459576.1 nicotinate (nicotinamide) nucleotide adenylyltransferase [Patescibacteria group bacterium]MBU2544183.1 nicotinate (nicotinamide) nucleotide adenylyltransferase [Patescibacteria group bacterium]